MPFTGNPFVDISTSPPLDLFPRREHPARPPTTNDGKPIPTNKFYTNILIGDQRLPTWTQPYSLWWSNADNFHGMAVSHVTREQFVYGPDPNAATTQYYFCPVGIQSIVFSSTAFNSGVSRLEIGECSDFSCKVNLLANDNSRKLTMYLVQGMGTITGIYNGLTPRICSQVGFASVNKVNSPLSNVLKYELKLFNNVRWLMYVIIPQGHATPSFSLSDNNHLVSNIECKGCAIQIASSPQGTADYYDNCAGTYVTSAKLTGEITDDGNRGTYRIKYSINGSRKPLVFAAPHHVASFASEMGSKKTPVQLDSTNMGKLTACIGTDVVMTETLPTFIGFSPYSSFKSADKNITNDQKNLITQVATRELDGDVVNESNLNSMYFSGKKLDKYAQIVFTCKYILNNDTLARKGLAKLKQAFERFSNNRQQNPLVYETTWRGLISVAGLNGDPLQDFGNSYYNDHNFHYGYFVHAAAVIALVDRDLGGNWVASVKPYVNNLIRDVANPSTDDRFFPRWRSFDWYAGHSWAKGILVSGDGKDQESSSEDFHFAYGMKLWGRVLGDGPMEARGNLMLAVLKRAMNTYMYYTPDNKVMPPKILGNKVSGILFENKVDYATWFSARTECKHGIHMIPVTSVSSYIRQSPYVRQEWDAKLGGIVDGIDDGWRGILYSNKALFDPQSSYNFFAQSNFRNEWLDDGMSRTWSLALPACFL